MEEDFENWVRFKTVGEKLRRKPGIAPHKFDCQTTRSAPPSKRTHTEDRHRQVQREEALREAQRLLWNAITLEWLMLLCKVLCTL